MTDAADIKPGVYFDLPDEFYHSIPALSSTGIKNLLISPMDYWARSFMNPFREDEVDSDARMIGKAYHKRILEGKEAFDACYAPDFIAPDECLKTVDEFKEALAAKGIEAKGKRKREDYVALARDSLPDALIYDDEVAKHEATHKGKLFLSQKLLDKIEISAAMIEKHPHLSKCFRGGYPEVSVIWEEDGILMKARFDYLKPKAIIDLKTFANQMNKPIDRAIYSAMAGNKYHIQAAFYLQAVERLKDFLRAGHTAVTPKRPDIPDTAAWFDSLLECEEHGFYFVFQNKGVAPVARGKKFERGMIYGAGVAAVDDAKRLYRACLAKFGTDPWLDDAPIDSFEDDNFPIYTTEM